MYHVKWKGYSVDEATWEPKTNLAHATALIGAFDAQKDKRTRAPNGTAAPKAAKATKAAKAAPNAAAPVKKAGRPPGRPRKTAAEAPAAAVSKSKAKVVKKPGRPAPGARRSGRPQRGVKA